MQGTFSASHVERDDVKGLTYNYAMDFTARGKGLYKVFCIPDDEAVEPYLLAELQDEACYVHRYVQDLHHTAQMLCIFTSTHCCIFLAFILLRMQSS